MTDVGVARPAIHGGPATALHPRFPAGSSAGFPVCVDGRMADWPEGTGVATYAATLVRALASIGRVPAILGDGGAAGRRGRMTAWLSGLLPVAAAAEHTPAGFCARDVFRRAQAHFNAYGRVLALALPGPAGVMHWTYPLPIRVAGWRNVYTVHDVVPILRPELTTIDGQRHRRLLAAIAARADGIVTVSDSARGEIAEAMAVPVDRIVNLSQAIDEEPVAPRPVAGLAKDGFLLFCGSVDARKNVPRIMAGHRLSGTTLPLVIAGPIGPPDMERAIAAAPGVTRLPHLPRAAILRLIADARALLFVTLDEGFGLPIVEAMRAGTPVVTASRGAACEVAGDAALTVDPEDVGAIAGAVRVLCDDDAVRGRLIRAGHVRAQAFALPAYAQRLAAYHEGLIHDRR